MTMQNTSVTSEATVSEAAAPHHVPPPLLSIPHFRNVLIGGTISQLGDVCFMVALPWLVLQMTGSGVALGSILMALAVPRAALMLLGGAMSDKFSARTILIVANAVLSVCVALVALLAWRNALQLWELYLVAFSFGVADAFGAPALRVLLPKMVDREQIQSANSMLQSTTQVCTLVGASIVGILIARWGLVSAFALDAMSFLFIIVALLTIPNVTGVRMQTPGIWRAILDGLDYVKGSVPLRSLLTLVACVNFCITGALQVGLVTVAHARFGSSIDFGLMVTAAAVGALAGALVAGVWKHGRPFGSTMLIACFVLGAFISALALQLPLWGMLVTLVLIGTVAGYVNVYALSWLQKMVKPEVLGRVMSVLGLSSVGVAPLSLAISGFLAQSHTQLLFVASGAGLLIVTAIIAVSGMLSVRRSDVLSAS
jgi:MFS family permease